MDQADVERLKTASFDEVTKILKEFNEKARFIMHFLDGEFGPMQVICGIQPFVHNS